MKIKPYLYVKIWSQCKDPGRVYLRWPLPSWTTEKPMGLGMQLKGELNRMQQVKC